MAQMDHTGNGRGYSRPVFRGVETEYRRGGRPKQRHAVDWAQVDGDLCWRLACAVLRAGDAILFTTSSDGGAFGVTICKGTTRLQKYLHHVEEIEAWMLDIVEEYEPKSYAPG